MSDVRRPDDGDPIGPLLRAHRPAESFEAADLVRVRELVETEADPWARSLPLHLTASALVVHPPTRRVLLRWHTRHKAWMHVGGHGDPGETEPLDVALREAREETSLGDLRPWPDRSLLQVAVVPVPATPKEDAHEHADLRFVFATDEPDAAKPERPDAPVRWMSVAHARELTAEPNVRRALILLEAVLHDVAGT